jgi:prophage tail gpP-like protein
MNSSSSSSNSDVTLTVNGADYGGWEEIRISRGMERIAGSFEFAVSERWPGQVRSRPIRPGDACSVQMMGEIGRAHV